MQATVTPSEKGGGQAADPVQGPRRSVHSPLLRELEQCKQELESLFPLREVSLGQRELMYANACRF